MWGDEERERDPGRNIVQETQQNGNTYVFHFFQKNRALLTFCLEFLFLCNEGHSVILSFIEFSFFHGFF